MLTRQPMDNSSQLSKELRGTLNKSINEIEQMNEDTRLECLTRIRLIEKKLELYEMGMDAFVKRIEHLERDARVG